MNNMFCFVNFFTESMQIEKHIKKKDQFDVGFGFLIDILSMAAKLRSNDLD